MSASIDKLLSDFIDAWNAGSRPRVGDYLRRAPEREREELGERLEDWLLVARGADHDEEALATIRADPAFARAAVEWQPQVALSTLRAGAGLALRDLAARVTSAFGLAGQEERAEGYLEQLERGDLDRARVSRRLFDVLAGSLGVPVERLAGGAPPSAAPAGGFALYRAESEAPASVEADLEALSRAALTPAPPPMDELDRLFLGGPGA